MGHIHIETHFLLADFFYLAPFYLLDSHLHLHLGTGYEEVDDEKEKPQEETGKEGLCPPSLIPHRDDVHEKFGGRFTPLAVVVASLHFKDIFARRKIGVTRPCE